ncbi:MAG: NAD(P)-dependent oxidoreductase [Chloroflexi bacterium]|nr:NAD(P)-dependent oxidoreductase [Chloroflexota bacterium]
MTAVGILNPGAMGASIAASARAAGHEVVWASAGRSAATQQRAAENDLRAVETLAELCAACEVIVCVCPPHAAEAVADAVISAGFDGLYCEGNAISPQKAQAIGARMSAAGIDFVDGSIVGPPAWQAGSTRFYLSGPSAGQVAALFAGTLTEAIAIGDEIGKASALKMTFAALTKGSTALLAAIYGVSENLGVRAELEREWGMRSAEAVAQRRDQVRGVTAKAWRFAGEMQEIAATFELAGMPPGFFEAAYEVYTRMADFKDADALPELEAVLAALTARES